MLYDTSLRFRMPYRGIMRQWTEEILAWAPGTPTLLGLPAYDDPGVGYHDASVENLENALKGMHAGSTSFEALPDSYRGVAIYSEWEMNDAKWTTLREQFRRTRA